MNPQAIKTLKKVKPRVEQKPVDLTNNKGRGYDFLWEVRPDYWKKTWGPVPLLGRVRADNEFDAVYAAYDKGIAIPNATFGLTCTKIKPLSRAEIKKLSESKKEK